MEVEDGAGRAEAEVEVEVVVEVMPMAARSTGKNERYSSTATGGTAATALAGNCATSVCSTANS